MRAPQAAIDRVTGNAYDPIAEGESYRSRQKPRVPAPASHAADVRLPPTA